MNSPEQITEAHVSELREQIDNLPTEQSFDAALEVVKREFESVRQRMIEKGHNDWQSIYLTEKNSGQIQFILYGNGSAYGVGYTLSEALENLPSPVDAKAKKISELRAELAKLESEASK